MPFNKRDLTSQCHTPLISVTVQRAVYLYLFIIYYNIHPETKGDGKIRLRFIENKILHLKFLNGK